MPLIYWDNGRLRRARELGSTKSPNELNQIFQKSDSAVPVLMGTIHGDLHAANVLVRGNDAIVIDFLANRYMPLIFDAACLEASLIVDGFASDGRDPVEWLSSIVKLYMGTICEGSVAVTHPKDSSAWFFSCVSQIRLYARQMQRKPGQYAAALAVALLKKAHKDPRAPEPESSRRAAAYVLAEKVLIASFEPPAPVAEVK